MGIRVLGGIRVQLHPDAIRIDPVQKELDFNLVPIGLDVDAQAAKAQRVPPLIERTAPIGDFTTKHAVVGRALTV